LFSDPTYDDLLRYYQAGSIAAYEHVAMIRLHFSISDALDDCIAKLEGTYDKTSSRRPVYTLDAGHVEKQEIIDEAQPSHNTGDHSSPVKIELSSCDDSQKSSTPSSLSGGYGESDDEDYEDLSVDGEE
jgi:hypothetical protein